MTDDVDLLSHLIYRLVIKYRELESETTLQRAVLGLIWAEYRISFGSLGREHFEELKQDDFFLDAVNRVRVLQYDRLLEIWSTILRLKNHIDN